LKLYFSCTALEVRPLFQASMLKPEILAKVWDLSDVNKDGVLDAEEWIIACHLIRLIKQGIYDVMHTGYHIYMAVKWWLCTQNPIQF